MSSTISLKAQRELLLLELQAIRIVEIESLAYKDTLSLYKPSSATMRFILQHPALCLWVADECLPALLSVIRRRFGHLGSSRKAI